MKPSSIIAYDFNNDTKLDLALANSGENTASLFIGNGDGNFIPSYKYTVGNKPSFILSGDFNNDNKLDLALTNGDSNQLSILLNSCE